MRMKKGVTSNSSKKAVRKTTNTYSDYSNMYSYKMKPVPDALLDKIAHDLEQWALTNPEAYKLTQFFVEKNLEYSDFYNWIKKHDGLRRAHERALMAIGNRREIGALKRELDAGMISFTMPHYDKTWKELVEWRAHLRQAAQSEGDQSKKIVVEMMPYPASDRVPPKKEHKEDGNE